MLLSSTLLATSSYHILQQFATMYIKMCAFVALSVFFCLSVFLVELCKKLWLNSCEILEAVDGEHLI